MERIFSRANKAEVLEATARPVVNTAQELARVCEQNEEVDKIVWRLQNMSIGERVPGDTKLEDNLHSRLHELVEFDSEVDVRDIISEL